MQELNADIKFYPEGMEFHDFDLNTGKSHLKNFFAMHFKSFDDLSDFTTKVKMEADFSNATIDSDDIGFFSSDLKTMEEKYSDIRNNKRICIRSGRKKYPD